MTMTKRSKAPQTKRIEPRIVYEISYACRPPCADEVGTVVGVWTGEIDTWGKLTIIPASGPTLYLFRDEIVSVERYS